MARIHSAKIKATSSSSRQDEIKKRNEKATSNNQNGKQKSAKTKGKADVSVEPSKGIDKFREEILALGGDEEDYELLKDLDSEAEGGIEHKSNEDAKLSKDLAKFMKGLDFASVRPQDVAEEEPSEGENDQDEDEDEPEEEEEGESDASEELGVPEETPEKKAGDITKQNITVPKIGKDARLLIEPTPQWYATVTPLPASSSGKPSVPPPQTLTTIQSKAASLHAYELSSYERATGASAHKLASSASDAAFLQRVLSSGTLSDRLSALTLMAQSSPLHNTRALETLKGMAQKKGREESLKALRAIVDWWVGGSAPDRKLKYLIDQPLTRPGVTDQHLLVWYFEDWLKKYFYSILQILEALSLDPLPYVRTQAMALIFNLLCEKPEQEQNLLRLLVNKLGDSERPVASRASYYLLRLLQAHPQMKAVIIREISSLILRPRTAGLASSSATQTGATHLKFTDGGSSRPAAPPKSSTKGKGKVSAVDKDKAKKDLQQEHAQYYAAITLNQIMLSPTEADRTVAAQLVGLYFELFKEILGSAGTTDTNTGAKSVGGEEFDHTRTGKEKRKRMEEKGGKGKGRDDGELGFAEVEDSSSRLISAILTGVNRALPFAKLGPDNVEFSKHIDTLFLICHKSTFNISLQALRLILQITQSLSSVASTSDSSKSLATSVTDRYYRTLYASLFDDRLSTSSKQAMYLNLLLKSLKLDTKQERIKAFVRRFVQVLVSAGNGGVEFVAGGLYLLGEIFKAEPGLRDLLDRSTKRPSSADGEYDPRKRDPQYACASASPMWELIPLLTHFHPTVRLHASQLLSGTPLTAHADLALNTLAHFLDRFVYRNPKAPRARGASAMQPGAVAPGDAAGVRAPRAGALEDADTVMVNDVAFWKRDVRNVPVDQIFFHKYFTQKNEKERARGEKVAKRKGGAADSGDSDAQSDAESASEENDESVPAVEKKPKAASDVAPEEDEDEESEDEEEIWNAIKATHPDLRGDGEDPSDSELSLSSDLDADSVADAAAKDLDENEADDKEDEDDEDNESDALSLAEHSSAASLVALSDVELPDGLIAYHSDSDVPSGAEDVEEDEEWGGFDADAGNAKRKRKSGDTKSKDKGGKKKRRLRALPTFATYDDYAALIDGAPEDNI